MNPGARLLVIEDELPMRTALTDVLAGEGYRVFSAADGEIGLQRALAEKPDLILLDLMMPKLDGASTLKAIRELDADVPVILASGLANPERIAHVQSLGASGFLQKPYSDVEVLEALSTLIAHRTRRR